MCVDLHIHSIYSDGTDTPEQIIRLAQDCNLTGVALTDHDTIAGIDEFLEHGEKKNIHVITGVEISAIYKDISLHILGYGINHHLNFFNEWLHRIQKYRQERNEKILSKLRFLGIELDNNELKCIPRYGQLGRPHIASLLVKKGIVQNMEQAFRRYLRKGAPAWSKRFAYNAIETIDMIHDAEGLAVLAHPYQIDYGMKKLPQLIAELSNHGLDGLEVYYPSHPPKITKRLQNLADQYGLLKTGGSDYHGKNKPGNDIADIVYGFCPPDTIMKDFMQRITGQTKKIIRNS